MRPRGRHRHPAQRIEDPDRRGRAQAAARSPATVDAGSGVVGQSVALVTGRGGGGFGRSRPADVGADSAATPGDHLAGHAPSAPLAWAIKEQIEVKVVIADRQMHLPAHEGEADAEFHQKFPSCKFFSDRVDPQRSAVSSARSHTTGVVAGR